MQEFEEDYYAILGVEETASPEEIRKAYLTLAKKLHPDRYPNDPDQRAIAQTEFARVTRAHDIVSDSESRTEYDTLRALSKKRSQIDANISAESESPDGSSSDASQAMARMQQAQTVVDDESINVKWANKHLSRADELYRKQKYQEAETAMKEAIRLVPNDPKYRNKLAEVYFARGWRTLALTEVQAALRISPRNQEAKTLESKIKAAVKGSEGKQNSRGKASLMDQIRTMFGGKKP